MKTPVLHGSATSLGRVIAVFVVHGVDVDVSNLWVGVGIIRASGEWVLPVAHHTPPELALTIFAR